MPVRQEKRETVASVGSADTHLLSRKPSNMAGIPTHSAIQGKAAKVCVCEPLRPLRRHLPFQERLNVAPMKGELSLKATEGFAALVGQLPQVFRLRRIWR